mgnify:CR=1 FL=1
MGPLGPYGPLIGPFLDADFVFLFYTNFNTVLVFLTGATILFFPIQKLLVLARKYMHEAWTNGQIAQKDIQSVIENIFIIKILNTTKQEIENFKNMVLVCVFM